MDDYTSIDAFFRGFMLNQRKDTMRTSAAAAVVSSLKETYSGTRAGTNGLRTDRGDVNADVNGKAGNGRVDIHPGDAATAGMGGV